MRDIERIDVICDKLKEMWKKFPDWRFTQMIVNFMSYVGSDCFYMEDEEFIEKLNQFIEEL